MSDKLLRQLHEKLHYRYWSQRSTIKSLVAEREYERGIAREAKRHAIQEMAV